MKPDADERRPRWRTAAVTAAAIVAVAGCGGGGGGGGSTSTAAGKPHRAKPSGAEISPAVQRAARRRLAKDLGVSPKRVKQLQSGRGLSATQLRPAEIVPGGPGPFFSSDAIYPIANGWEAGDRRTYTAVDAGANPAKPSIGELGIFRQDFIKATQSQKVVNVPGAGTLRIVKAPLGRGVASSAQRSGELEFAGSRGVRGVLHLADDSVTITRR